MMATSEWLAMCEDAATLFDFGFAGMSAELDEVVVKDETAVAPA